MKPLGIGIVGTGNIAGGYARDISDSVEIHANTIIAARRLISG